MDRMKEPNRCGPDGAGPFEWGAIIAIQLAAISLRLPRYANIDPDRLILRRFEGRKPA